MSKVERMTPGDRVRKMTETLGGIFRVSQRDVPHVVVELGNEQRASVCYFGRTQTWRVFFPYMQFQEQTKTNHASVGEVVVRIEELRKQVAAG